MSLNKLVINVLKIFCHGGKAKIFRTETSAGMLEKLVKKFQKHKQSVQALLLKQEYQRTQAAQRQKMLENLDEDIKPQTKVSRIHVLKYVCVDVSFT